MNNLQINIILLALGGIQGIFLFLLLFQKRKVLPGYVFLAVYLITMILQIMMKLAAKIWLLDTMRPIYFLSYHLPLLYGPLIWLFVGKISGKTFARKNTIPHFIPFLFFSVLICITEVRASYLPGFFLSAQWTIATNLLSLTAYHAFALLELKKYNQTPVFPENILHKATARWLIQLVIVSFAVCSLISIAIFFMYIFYPRFQDLRYCFSSLTLFIYWVCYKAWNKPDLFQVITGKAKPDQNHLDNGFMLHPVVRKYSNSGLREEDLQRIVKNLESRICESKCFLNPDLTIDELAAQLYCSRHHLSEVINRKLGKSFNDYINYYRVEEAGRLLTDPERNTFKIASLAYDAGFNSISTFNDAFKKIKGLTPSQYRKQREENNLRKQRV